jgi:D-3-phosphoglycerate dehydrogenase / 2-oxoglutarate reductase
MHKPICIITEPDWIPDNVLDVLRENFEIEQGPFTRDALIKAASRAAGFYVGLDHIFDEPLLPENLRFIVSPTTGLNHIDLNIAKTRNIAVISLKGEEEFLRGITATAELCWGLVLALKRYIPAACASVVQGEWDRDRFQGRELKDATIGIIGLGRLGEKIARYARAFDMRVLAHTLHPQPMEGVELVSLHDLLARSDIVTLHADSRPENYHMIGAEQFKVMKRGSVFINTARGDLVDEAALLNALQSGHLGGAALDVLEQEFNPAHSSAPLIDYARQHDTLLITPHIGGVTRESLYKTTHFTAQKLLKYWAELKGAK